MICPNSSGVAREPYYDADGRFIYNCCRCGREAAFGAALREGKLSTWNVVNAHQFGQDRCDDRRYKYLLYERNNN